MDILNWLYLAKNKFVRTTPSSDKDLMVFGAKVGFNKRGDLYQNYAMSIEDFAAALPAPAPAYKVYTALLSQSGTAAPVAIVLENTMTSPVTIARSSQGTYTVSCNDFNFFTLKKTAVSAISANNYMLVARTIINNPTTFQLTTFN